MQIPAGTFHRVTGYLVADRLNAQPDLTDKIVSLRSEDLYAQDWRTLFSNAISQWQEFLEILVVREPVDERLKALAQMREGQI